jgi:hypothetical protein
MNMPSNFGFTALRSIIIDGSDKVVMPIIKESTTPRSAPLASRASAIGIVPKISAYIGTPATVARITPKGLLPPSALTIHSSGKENENEVDGTEFLGLTLEECRRCVFTSSGVTHQSKQYKMTASSVSSLAMLLQYLEQR